MLMISFMKIPNSFVDSGNQIKQMKIKRHQRMRKEKASIEEIRAIMKPVCSTKIVWMDVWLLCVAYIKEEANRSHPFKHFNLLAMLHMGSTSAKIRNVNLKKSNLKHLGFWKRGGDGAEGWEGREKGARGSRTEWLLRWVVTSLNAFVRIYCFQLPLPGVSFDSNPLSLSPYLAMSLICNNFIQIFQFPKYTKLETCHLDT